MLGVLLVAIVVAAVGFGVDLTRLMLVKSRLQTSVDAAALVAGREMNLPISEAETDAKALFWSNFGRTGTSTDPNNKGYKGYLGAVAGDPTFTRPSGDVNTVTVNATATVEMTLMAIVGAKTTTVPAQASAKRAVYGMELALVLDITGSMGPNVDANGNTMTSSSIAGLRTAATNLLDAVYGANDTQPNLYVSVTQFAASVNIGKGNEGWLVPGSLDQNKYGDAKWAGCVEARTGPAPYNSGEDQTDTPPANSFVPYLWRSTIDTYKSGNNDVTGDNDWYYRYNGLNKAIKKDSSKITEQQQADYYGAFNVGPNLTCAPAAILPLTASKAKIKKVIDAIVAVNARGGTTGNLGLQAGWWTISPRWTGLWGGTPTTGLPNGAISLPLDYNSLLMQKVVVFMTDGNNQWYDWPYGAPGELRNTSNYQPIPYDGKMVPPSTKPTTYNRSTIDADYTAYGRLSENRLGVANNSIDAAKTELDKRSIALCTKMKNVGITIYTVILGGVDNATKALWQGCASKPENYFNSPNKEDLAKAFQQIGTQLASLRLTL